MSVSPLNPMIEMTALFYGRPGAGASDEAVAEWYRAKGRMHEQLAAKGGPDATQELQYAAASYEHARRLEAAARLRMAA
ncbi:hypothetical protein Lesp02_83200 [Lentzea sp. NBRC 105346]|uniref:hypothetical protein n=1 Tax=Lentzea sp. NBRC 105346 TaxID=3032205 RepID=UPI0024A59DBF|nr:hypothetical protein [Lentzea sp. NBRC 105346]GLZ36133.1 hypothetical protein Lesp02_83200 [Lentzea sp. NBRC 105346]